MKEKTYAPVIIPTLNRYDHFRQCLESLERCTGSENTDVYIGLDYPPSERYVEGWKKTDDYLKIKEKFNGFRTLIVIRHNSNCGVFKINSNSDRLMSIVLQQYDRFIFSEDDNIFSPNFLEYINKGLELFKDDKSVFAINGYSHPYPIKYIENSFFRQNVDFSAWGYGIWANKFVECSTWIDSAGFKKSYSTKTLLKVLKNGYNRAIRYLSLCCAKEKILMTDNVLSIYMAIKDMDVVMPNISLVRNCGWDDSGIHCTTKNKQLAQIHSQQMISCDTNFEYIGTGYEFYDENKVIFRDNTYAKVKWIFFFVAIFKFYIRKLIHY